MGDQTAALGLFNIPAWSLGNGLQCLAQHYASNETPFKFIKTERYICESPDDDYMPVACQEKATFERKPEPSQLPIAARNLANTPRVRPDKSNICKITKQIKRMQAGSDISIDCLKSAKSCPYSMCCHRNCQKTENHENNDLLLFFELQQI